MIRSGFNSQLLQPLRIVGQGNNRNLAKLSHPGVQLFHQSIPLFRGVLGLADLLQLLMPGRST